MLAITMKLLASKSMILFMCAHIWGGVPFSSPHLSKQKARKRDRERLTKIIIGMKQLNCKKKAQTAGTL